MTAVARYGSSSGPNVVANPPLGRNAGGSHAAMLLNQARITVPLMPSVRKIPCWTARSGRVNPSTGNCPPIRNRTCSARRMRRRHVCSTTVWVGRAGFRVSCTPDKLYCFHPELTGHSSPVAPQWCGFADPLLITGPGSLNHFSCFGIVQQSERIISSGSPDLRESK